MVGVAVCYVFFHMEKKTFLYKQVGYTLPIRFSTSSVQETYHCNSKSNYSWKYVQIGWIMLMYQRPGAWWEWKWVCRDWLVRIWGRLWKFDGVDFRFPPKLKDLESFISNRLTFSGALSLSTCLSLFSGSFCLSTKVCLFLLMSLLQLQCGLLKAWVVAL